MPTQATGAKATNQRVVQQMHQWNSSHGCRCSIPIAACEIDVFPLLKQPLKERKLALQKRSGNAA